MEKASGDVDKNFKNLGSGIAKGLKVGVAAATATGAAMLALVPATQEYRAEQAKLVSAFETAGASADVAKSTYTDLYKVLGESDTSVEAANHLAQLTTNEQALSEWTNICQGVYATFGDSLPIEGLTEAANETAKVGTVTGSLADALNWAKGTNEEFAASLSGNKEAQDAFNQAIAGGATREDAFNAALAACNTEAEREALIRSSLSAIYDEAAAKYGENAAAIMAYNEEQAKLQENLAALGEAMTPVLTAFISFANDALAVVIPYIQQFAEQYGPKLQEVLGVVAEQLGQTLGFIQEHSTLMAVIAGVIGTIVVAIGLYNAVAAVKAAMDAAQVVTLAGLATAYLAQAAAMIVAIAPYVLIVAAIAAVIAIIVVCIKHWDDIKAKVSEVWGSIKEKVSEGVQKVKDKFEEMKTNMVQKVEDAKQKVKDKFEQIKTNISEKVEGAKNAVRDKFESMKTAISEKVESAKSAVTTKFDAIKSNITQKVEAAKSSVQNVFDSIKSKMESTIESAKSSITSKFDTIKSKITSAINGARDAVQSAVNKIKSIMNFSWSLPKLKLPHISISGRFSINPPSVPRFSISWHKMGGVFDSPHLFGYGNGMLGGLGEDGAEAVVPLEKNTKWLDIIADKLNGKSSNARIVLQVDGKTFGEIAVDSINDLTRMRGNLPLAII